MLTTKRTFGTSTEMSTPMTEFRSVQSPNLSNMDSSSFCFVLDESLQLIERPVTNPIIQDSASAGFSYSFEVFHHDSVSFFQSSKNLFADVVVVPSHKTVFPSAKTHKKPLCGSSAFSLEFGAQIFESSFNLLNLACLEESSIRTNSEVIDSKINSDSFTCCPNILNLFIECEVEETSAFFVDFQETLSYTPIPEIPCITVGHKDIEFLPAFDGCNAQDVVFKRCASWKVVPYRSMFYDGFGFGFLDNSASLLDACDGELALQPQTFDLPIDKGVEFNIVPDSACPSNINTVLQSFTIDFEGFNYLRSCRYSDFGSRFYFHTYKENTYIYKLCEHMSSEKQCTQNLDEKTSVRKMYECPVRKSKISEKIMCSTLSFPYINSNQRLLALTSRKIRRRRYCKVLPNLSCEGILPKFS